MEPQHLAADAFCDHSPKVQQNFLQSGSLPQRVVARRAREVRAQRPANGRDVAAADPIIGLETGSARLFNTYMKGKAYPYKPNQWRDVVLKGMEILNRHNWFPFCTFIIGLPGETDDDTKQSLDLLYDLRHAKGMFVPTFFVPLEHTRMEQTRSAKLIEMTDLQWEFFFTCWKYNMEFWRGRSGTTTLKFSAGAPIYYGLLGNKLFGSGIKYSLLRLAGVPDRWLRWRLYLDFTGYKRDPKGMDELLVRSCLDSKVSAKRAST